MSRKAVFKAARQVKVKQKVVALLTIKSGSVNKELGYKAFARVCFSHHMSTSSLVDGTEDRPASAAAWAFM